MRIVPIVGGAAYQGGNLFDVTYPVLEGTNIALTAGYYSVDLVFKYGLTNVPLETGGKTTSVRQILHIHQNLSSNFAFVFSKDDFIVTGGTLAGIAITYTPNTDEKPVVSSKINTDAVTPTTADNEVITLAISRASNSNAQDLLVLTVTNQTNFDGPLEWYLGQTLLAGAIVTGTGDSVLTLTAGTGILPGTGTYRITVVGYKENDETPTPKLVPYGTYFSVKVVATAP